MSTRTGTSPAARLARTLTACNEKAGAPSYRELRDRVEEVLGEAHKVSYETLRKYHNGDQEWGNIRIDVVKALARIYGKTLRQVSPELADIDEGNGPTQRRQSKTWSMSENQTVSPATAQMPLAS